MGWADVAFGVVRAMWPSSTSCWDFDSLVGWNACLDIESSPDGDPVFMFG